ncbi:MAG: EboA domain-containing protein [Methylocystis sp.]
MSLIETLLFEWLERRTEPQAVAWLRARVAETRQAEVAKRSRVFETAFARVPRMLGRTLFALSEDDLATANCLRPGWSPRDWRIDDAARALLLLAMESVSEEVQFVAVFRRLRQSADPPEQVALFRSLPLLKPSAGLKAEAEEGLRTNIPSVFAALAHDNPFAREVFDEARWNQMILKALFIGCALGPIQGLDARANPRLALMLRDFARERRTARRSTPHELWRCLGPFAREAAALEDLALALNSSDPSEREAAEAVYGGVGE